MSQLPDLGSNPVRLSWELHSPADIQIVWTAFSDTDRFNEVAGMGFSFEEIPQADGTTKRIGRSTRLGLIKLQWEEQPFQYSRPGWFQVLRVFQGSPATAYRLTCRLRPEKQGTAIRYSVEIFPRNVLARLLVVLEAQLFVKSQLDGALKQLMASLREGREGLQIKPPKLSRQQADKLVEACKGITPLETGKKLAEFVMEAPLSEQDPIHPLSLAARMGIEKDAMVKALLQGVRGGILTLNWDLICPSCLKPKKRESSLANIQQRVHCPSCNVYYDGTFPDSLAVTFRPTESIREINTAIQCVGSPGRQRQVIVQKLLGAKGEGSLDLNLEAGTYRLRTWPPSDTALLVVDNETSATNPQFHIEETGLRPFKLQAKAGEVSLRVQNTKDIEYTVFLESQHLPVTVYTVGSLMGLTEAKDLLPEELIRPEIRTSTQRMTVLAVRVLSQNEDETDKVIAKVKEHNPMGTLAANGRIIATFQGAQQALASIKDLLPMPNVACVLHDGPVVQVELSDRTLYSGDTVNLALNWLRQAHPGSVACARQIGKDDAWLRAFQEAGLQFMQRDGGDLGWIIGV